MALGGIRRAAARRSGTAVRGSDRGFTLIEMLVTMAISSILIAAAVWALRAYSDSQSEKGTADRMISALRDTAERAQSEGRVYCVSFDPDGADPSRSVSWSVWEYSCTPWTGTSIQGDTISSSEVGSGAVQGKSYISAVSFTAPSTSWFTPTCPASSLGCIYFFPRGIASSGSLTVSRSGSSKTYDVNVEGLTSRVYLG